MLNNRKFLSIISITTFLFVFLSSFTIAGAQSNIDPKFKKFTDADSEVTFMIPENAFILRANNEEKLSNAFLSNGQPLVRIDWSGMVAQIDRFDVGFDFNHIDWLNAYAKFSALDVVSVKTVENEQKIRMGSLEYKADQSAKASAVTYLAIAGGHGYLISGLGEQSNPLVNSVASTLTLSGKRWGSLDSNQTIKFAGYDLEFNTSFTDENRSEGDANAKVVFNSTTIAESSILLLLKQGVNKIHSANVRRFKGELLDLKLRIKNIRSNKNEEVFNLVSENGDSFVGFVTTTQGGVSVALLVPAIDNDPNAWLSGKYYYIRTLQALK